MEATMQLSQLNTQLRFRGEILDLHAEVVGRERWISLRATDSEGFSYMTISIFPVGSELQEEGVIDDNQGILVIKDYSENQGIEDALRSEGILGEPDGAVPVGYTICSVYIINLPKGEKL